MPPLPPNLRRVWLERHLPPEMADDQRWSCIAIIAGRVEFWFFTQMASWTATRLCVASEPCYVLEHARIDTFYSPGEARYLAIERRIWHIAPDDLRVEGDYESLEYKRLCDHRALGAAMALPVFRWRDGDRALAVRVARWLFAV
jgi:hypothetical protein